MNKEFHGTIIKALDDPENKWEMLFEARPSTPEVDRYGESTLTSAFMAAMPKYMAQQPVMMFNHREDWTIGRVLDYRSDATGPLITGGISKTEHGKEVATLIRDGVVTSMSFQFGDAVYEDQPETRVRNLTSFTLYEIGPVSIPANPTATITMAKAFDIELTEKQNSPGDGYGHNRKGKGMPELKQILDKVEEMQGGFKTAVDSLSTEVKDLHKNHDQYMKLLTELGVKQEEKFKGIVPAGEFQTFVEKIGNDILSIREDVKKVGELAKNEGTKQSFKSWKYSPMQFVKTFDDQGHPVDDLHQKALHIMRSPVKYDGDEGVMLKALRDLNDTLVTMDAVYSRKGMRDELKKSKTYQLYRDLLTFVDPEFSKAMSTTGTGLGTEWLNVGYSAELYDLYRLESNLESLIPSFDLPTKSYVWPYLASGPTMYRFTEPTTNNPATATKSNLGTGSITFTAGDFAVAVPVSTDAIEDLIIPIVSEIRVQIAKAAGIGVESWLVNADATATHHDNASNTRWATSAPETYETGLMEHALTDSLAISSASTSAGVGDATAAFVADDLRYLRSQCGVLGKDPRKFVYVASIKGWFRMLNFTPMVQGVTYLNQPGSWLTGELPPFDGCRVVVSAAVPDNVANTGLYTDGTTSSAFTFVLGFHPEGFKIGNRRSFTLEYDYSAQAQQYVFVSTIRKSFQRMALAAASRYPVAASIAIAI